MGWGFRRSIRLGPGLRLNLSKSGAGLSFGVRGVRFGVGPKGKRTQLSIPGTGIFFRKDTAWGGAHGRRGNNVGALGAFLILVGGAFGVYCLINHSPVALIFGVLILVAIGIIMRTPSAESSRQPFDVPKPPRNHDRMKGEQPGRTPRGQKTGQSQERLYDIFEGLGGGDPITIDILREIWRKPMIGPLWSMTPPRGLVDLFLYHVVYATALVSAAADMSTPDAARNAKDDDETAVAFLEGAANHLRTAVELAPPPGLVPPQTVDMVKEMLRATLEKLSDTNEDEQEDILSEDYYEILQVSPAADPSIIKSAYRTMMNEMKMHPDVGGTTENAQKINEAYEVLSNPEKRREYDRKRGTEGAVKADGEHRAADSAAPATGGPINCPLASAKDASKPCPRRAIRSRGGFIKHLTGTREYGGHGQPQHEAEALATRAFG